MRRCPTHGILYPDRCPHCRTQTERNRVRPSAHARGYNAAHNHARAQLKLTLPAPCQGGCGRTLTPTSDWVAAHVQDGNPNAGWIATCRSCNERMKRRG